MNIFDINQIEITPIVFHRLIDVLLLKIKCSYDEIEFEIFNVIEMEIKMYECIDKMGKRCKLGKHLVNLEIRKY